IVLAYEYSSDVVKGTATGGVPRLFRPLLRRLVVDSTLRAGKVHKKGEAPALFRPSDTPPAKSELLDRLHRAVAAFESALRSNHPEARQNGNHPAFGVVPTVNYVRLQAIHARHHRAQLSCPDDAHRLARHVRSVDEPDRAGDSRDVPLLRDLRFPAAV